MKKTALITGGVRGIGLAVAKAFLEKGYRVLVSYSKDKENAELAKQAGLEVVRADVAKEEDVLALFSRVEHLDVLVNNAGVSLFKQIQDVSAEDCERVFGVNIYGAILCAREAAKRMITQKSGAIVNISSVWGEVGGSCESVYSASKAALIGLTKALAKELGYSGVRVNCVSPGVIDTQMNARLLAEEKAALQEEIPLGALGKAEDVASAVLALVENGYITGVDLPVNGGFSIV
ncbi:MAG: SDR family oxidoreductase [Clostridia bacterium]|nr:SDR family oxidoreductase [Clostridia bacterium]